MSTLDLPVVRLPIGAAYYKLDYLWLQGRVAYNGLIFKPGYWYYQLSPGLDVQNYRTKLAYMRLLRGALCLR